MQMRRGTAIVLAALMMVFGGLPGLADERPGDDRIVDARVAVETVDRTVDRPVDRPVDREIDRVRDREVDRYRCVDFVTDRRCIDDRHPHVNIRHLIQRLIHAGEWEKLFRLLHRLGII